MNTFTLTEPIRMEFVHVPAGPFLMGSDKSKDADAYDDELPHTVDVAEFYIGKYPVTNAQYAVFVEANGREAPSPGKDNHPVVNVSWHDAVAFTEWLSQQTGKPFRLPTEAEWEKAARGTDGRLWSWGDEWNPKRANTYEDGPKDTTPVGAYSPGGDSPYGCADMTGNVWEWCSTKWRDNYSTPADDSPGGDDRRVVRGGSGYRSRRLARCAFRLLAVPEVFHGDLGFRVVASLSDSGF